MFGGAGFTVCSTIIVGIGAAQAAELKLPQGMLTYTAEDGLAIRFGETSLRPMDGFGPVFDFGDGPLAPGEYEVEAVAEHSGDDWVESQCLARAEGREAAYAMRIDARGDEIEVQVSSDSPLGRGVSAGLVDHAGPWQRYDLTRLQETHGQWFWPRTNYLPELGLFFCGEWLYEDSHASGRADTDPMRVGEGPFPAAPNLQYLPRSDGTYAPIHERLVLRVAEDLVDALPRPRQAPSRYRDEMAGMVFLDLWGGSAGELSHFLDLVRVICGEEQRFLTVLQPWEVGGWDALLPDSIWLPDYPPDASVGTIDELRELCERGKAMGRFAFRTNYMLLRDQSPSALAGLAHHATDAEGNPKWHTRPSEWPALVARQEAVIRDLWAPNAGFTDQLTSGAWPGSWLDFDSEGDPGAGTLGGALEHQKAMARAIRSFSDGPLGSESLIDQHLIGEYVDFGDFGIMNGHNRAPCPEYHLRVMRDWAVFHGMGLNYRFVEPPPFDRFHRGECDFWSDRVQQDDYRCMEVLYGNGGYLMYGPLPWPYVLTELLLVGRLQPYYATARAVDVHYERVGDWLTLDDMVRRGFTYPVEFWNPQPEEFRRVRVRYDSGLTVIVNRREDPMRVEALGVVYAVPQYGWIAWLEDGSLTAYSALHPETGTRVDFLDDQRTGHRYLDPRGEEIGGVAEPAAWLDGRLRVLLREEAGEVEVDGRRYPLAPPAPAPLTTLFFSFDEGVEGWRARHGILTMSAEDGRLALRTVHADPQLGSPPLRVDGDDISVIVIRMRTSAGEMGQLYWATEEAPGTSEDRVVRFDVQAGEAFQECRLRVGEHVQWRGQVITSLRLDPIHGPDQAEIEIDEIRGE